MSPYFWSGSVLVLNANNPCFLNDPMGKEALGLVLHAITPYAGTTDTIDSFTFKLQGLAAKLVRWVGDHPKQWGLWREALHGLPAA